MGIIQRCSNENTTIVDLPWSSSLKVNAATVEYSTLPAKYSAQTLLQELFNIFERKLNLVSNEDPVDKMFNKTLRRGEDAYLDNLLRTLNGICEVCLPSVLNALIKWHEEQQKVPINETGETQEKAMKRTLAASYLYCVVLIEVLPQVQFYPTECDQIINHIVSTSFKQVSYRDPQKFGVNYSNSLVVAEIFGEVIGVLSQRYFQLIHKTFSSQLDLLRKETPFTSLTVRKIISLLMAMKFFRIQTSIVSDFEMGVKFLDELGSYYLEVDLKQKDLKHALAGLLLEILLPAAGEIKTEANIPSLISFVNKLYSPTYELVNKKAHRMAAYPLVTCLLCISQTKFFLDNWVQFLNLTLANLKNKDMKVSRVALESLYRLLWVYTIRINCEGNTATRSRLESICSSLFPKGNRNVIPRDSPIIIFVKIIHFIAYQKLDFAFREIIFDLLGCNRVSRSISIYPERMNIGIRALMVITDGLQQKEGPPGLPRSMGPVPPSGTIQRIKRTYLTHPLTADVARSIGLEQYYYPCRKAFDAILRTLDTQVGRNFLLTSSGTRGKEPEDLFVGDVKPKLDLFRTCVAAVPRLLPDPMSHQELIELLIRLSIHMDEELRITTCQTLQNLISECREWREDIINTYLTFLTNHIQDTFPTLLESAVRFLFQLLCAWKTTVQLEKRNAQQQPPPPTAAAALNGMKSPTSPIPSTATSASVSTDLSAHSPSTVGTTPGGTTTTTATASELGSPFAQRGVQLGASAAQFAAANQTAVAIHNTEGFALMLMCQTRAQTKKMAISLLKECRLLLGLIGVTDHDTPMISVLEEATPYIVKKYIEHVPPSEKQTWGLDFVAVCEKICNIDVDAFMLVNADRGNEYMRWDPWACALSGLSEYQFLPSRCPTAVAFAWPALYHRLQSCSQFVDPSNPQNENRASLLRSSKSKATASSLCGEALSQESFLSLWQKYLVMCCALAPPNNSSSNSAAPLLVGGSVNARSFSPGAALDLDVVRSMSTSTRTTTTLTATRPPTANPLPLFVKVANMLRWEHTDMRDSVVLGVGSTNPACFEYLLDELSNRNILRETQERKPESNARRRKRRDLLRLQVLRVMEMGFFRGLLEHGTMIDPSTGQLSPVLLKIIDALRENVVSDSERDITVLTSLRLHFAKSITLAINSIPLERRKFLLPPESRRELVNVFFKWCGRTIGADRGGDKDVGTYVEQHSVNALSALLCCGPIFDQKKDEDYFFRMLDALLSSSNPTVCSIFSDTLSTILHLNDQHTQLFEWTITMCYTQPGAQAVKAFKAIVQLFSRREFPCDFVCLFVLCQVYALDADAGVQQAAILLLQILRKEFLDDSLSPNESASHSMRGPKFRHSDLSPLESGRRAATPEPLSYGCGGGAFPINYGVVSRQLASRYPQLTMPIFSEVCSRLESARPNRQAAMLTILLQWIGHIELVDPFCEDAELLADAGEADESVELTVGNSVQHNLSPSTAENVPLRRKGWGSAEATQLLLNNLIHITTRHSAEHGTEIAALWRCLAASFDTNLPIILHILYVMMSLSTDGFIPVAKRITGFLLPVCGDRLTTRLMDQLNNSGEQFKLALIRSEMAPFYRWQPVQPDNEDTATEIAAPIAAAPNPADEDPLDGDQSADSALTATPKKSANPPMSSAANTDQERSLESVDVAPSSLLAPRGDEEPKRTRRQPRQLPMPAYGGHYANLAMFLPPSTQPVAYFSKSNLSLFLLSDLIAADTARSVNWTAYAPTLLNVSITSLDSTRPLVCRHARLTVLSLCLYFSPKDINVSRVATLLLNNQLNTQRGADTFAAVGEALFAEGRLLYAHNQQSVSELSDAATTVHCAPSPERCADFRRQLFASNALFPNSTQLLMAIAHCLTETLDRPLWANEEVNARSWRIESADRLGCFVRHLAEYFIGALPSLPQKWTEVAMGTALQTSNRHIAGRCFQVCGALCQSLAPYIGRILPRLVEIVGEFNDDAQCYITHLILCLHSAVPQIIQKTPTVEVADLIGNPSPTQSGHNRSISYTPALLQRPASRTGGRQSPTSPNIHAHTKKDARTSLLIEHDHHVDVVPPLNRCKSATTIKVESAAMTDEAITALSQLISICSCLLESPVDNEYLLALHLLNYILECANRDKAECVKRFSATVEQLDWPAFPGVVALAARGLVYTNGYETAVAVMRQCVDVLTVDAIGGNSATFPLIVVATLPYFLHNFDSVTPVGADAAKTIGDYCRELLPGELKGWDSAMPAASDNPLHNLATMMNQYREGSYARDKFQWMKAVVSYLIDAFEPNVSQLVVFISEILERAPNHLHVYLLHMIYLLLAHGDLSDASPIPLNSQVVRVAAKHVQSLNWREAARILKCILDQWNRISVNRIAEGEIDTALRKPDFELFIEKAAIDSATSPHSPRKLAPQPSAGNVDSLRRQTNAVQARVRERLVSLLTASGLPVGLPRSSSVIFSQSSGDVHHDATMAAAAAGGILASNSNMQTVASNSAFSSSEIVSHPDELEAMSGSSLANAGNESVTTDTYPRVFKEFDFLEAEHDSISESNESCFNWLSSMRPQLHGTAADADAEEPNDDDGAEDYLNADEEEDEIDINASIGRGVAMRSAAVVHRRRGGSGASSLSMGSQKRPTSGASENDISSDRTPVQSEKHSDDSLPPSSPSSDDDRSSTSASSDDEEDISSSKRSSTTHGDKSQRHAAHQNPAITSPVETNSTTSFQVNDDANMFDTASSINCRSEFSQLGAARGSSSGVGTSAAGGGFGGHRSDGKTSARRHPVFLECNHHTTGVVESAWLANVHDVENDQDGEVTAHAIILFTQLFRESCVKLSGLLRDASHLLTTNATTIQVPATPGSTLERPPRRDISAYFTHALNVTLGIAECPFIFVTSHFLRATNLLQPEKFTLYLLRQHFETFSERREQCIRVLNSMKSALKLQSLGSSQSSLSTANLEMDLCKCFEKLFFQLLQMLEKLNEVMRSIRETSNSQDFDLSPAITRLQCDLLGCAGEMPVGDSRLSTTSLSVAVDEQLVDRLILHLTNKNYRNALITLRQLRAQYGSEFGCCEHMDVEVLLVQYCQAHRLRTWAIVGSAEAFRIGCDQLKEANMQLSSLVRTLVADYSTGSFRGSRVGSVSDTMSAANFGSG